MAIHTVTDTMELQDVLALHYERRFTGELRLHLAQGRVVTVEIPREPERIRIAARNSVDIPRKLPQTLTR
jgi:hypothetical protein